MRTTTDVNFRITEFGETGIMLVREETDLHPTPGICPTHAQVIIMNKEEINLLMYTLGSHADKR